MPSTLGPDNPITWAQVRLRGGWTTVFVTGGLYALVVGGGILATTQLTTASPSAAYGGWLPGLLGLQVAVLLMFGTSRVTAAVRADHATRMIESHRLMPVGGGQAVFGYLAGSTCQASVLAAVNVVLGVFVAREAGFSVNAWLVVNLVLAAFCAFVWVLSALWAFHMRLPFLVLVLPMLAAFLSGGLVIAAVPAVTLLVSPLVGNTIFGLRAGATELSPARAVSLLAQAFVATICFIGAGRRFRRGDVGALTTPMGLLLLAGWVAISCTAVAWWDDFRPTFLSRYWVGTDAQLIGSLLSTLLVALVPVAGLTREERDWRRRVPDDPRPARRPAPGAALAILATAITTALVWVAVAEKEFTHGRLRRYPLLRDMLDPTLRTAAVVFLFLLGSGYLLRILGRFGFRPAGLFTIWLILTWAGPLLGDVARYALDDQGGPTLGVISTIGPPGALAQLWLRASDFRVDTTLGLGAQALMAGILAVVYYRTREPRAGRAIGAAVSPAVPPGPIG